MTWGLDFILWWTGYPEAWRRGLRRLPACSRKAALQMAFGISWAEKRQCWEGQFGNCHNNWETSWQQSPGWRQQALRGIGSNGICEEAQQNMAETEKVEKERERENITRPHPRNCVLGPCLSSSQTTQISRGLGNPWTSAGIPSTLSRTR